MSRYHVTTGRTRAVLLVAGLLGIVAAGPRGQSRAVEWRYFGADLAGSKYSAADQITRTNVADLDVAWEWQPNEKSLPQFHNALPGNFANTPIMIDGVLYVSTSYNTVAALDAETGRELWRYDPHAYEEIQPQATGWTHRGLTPWWDGTSLRIFLATKHRLISLDARTGRPVPAFAGSGEVDLSKNLRWEFNPEHLSNQSAPVVYKDVVIVGWGIGDRLMYRNDPPGVVRAYHARTGKELWTFNLVPARGEFGTDTWGAESWRFTGHANVWATMAVDTERGLVYLPTSTPSNDYYGGRRPGANLFAESLVCLDAMTGKRKWHFQTVHHGLWDYDLPATPNLVTITVNGRRIDAVAQVTKTGVAFVFDRVTGQPVWPIEERPVSTDSDVPGERPYSTQPFPTKPPPFAGQGISLDDAFDLTPELKAAAQAEMKKFRIGPLFTPPSMEGTLVRPTGGGGANWGGAAFDPESGRLFVKSSDNVGVLKIEKFDKASSRNPFASWSDADYVTAGGGGTFAGGLPLVKPPYAHLTAIDLNTGEIGWRIPFGRGSDSIRRNPALAGVALPERLGTPGPSGSIVTRGGLLFIGGGDEALYAFDKQTGAEVWHRDLPRRTGATPMTYQTSAGRQFVVVATGSGTDQSLVAFALKGTRESQTLARAGNANLAQPASSGRDAYERACMNCHGRDARGAIGPPLLPFARTANELLGIVRAGGNQMMGFSRADVSDTEVMAIGDYLRGLGSATPSAPSAGADAVSPPGDGTLGRPLNRVTDAMLAGPPAADWLHWRRTLDAWGFSPLNQISRTNVKDLRMAWSWAIEAGPNQTTPIVHDGVLFLANPGNVVQALDGRTGDLLWEYRRPLDDRRRQSAQTRSLAIHDDLIYLNTVDAHVVALDATSGAVRWDATVGAPDSGFTFTSGPIVADGVVVAGLTGCSRFDAETCYIVGLDAGTGKELWRTSTIARPGERGGDTWGDLPVTFRAGGDAWMPGSYDPTTRMIYWGTAQAKPWAQTARGTDGDALYTNSTLALNVRTGAIQWYFQHVPGESFDMDEAFERILVDHDGLKSVYTMGKLGILWELDRTTGRFVRATDLGYQTLVDVNARTGRTTYKPGMLQSAGREISFCPSTGGFKSLRAMAYHPETSALYVPLNLNCETATFEAVERKEGGGGVGPVRVGGYQFHPKSPAQTGELVSMNVRTGEVNWRQRRRAPFTTSTLTTGGGLVFVGAWDRYAFAYDAVSGARLWEVRLPTMANGFPITYSAGGKQYVAISAGSSIGGSSWATIVPTRLLTEIHNPRAGNGLYVFSLPD